MRQDSVSCGEKVKQAQLSIRMNINTWWGTKHSEIIINVRLSLPQRPGISQRAQRWQMIILLAFFLFWTPILKRVINVKPRNCQLLLPTKIIQSISTFSCNVVYSVRFILLDSAILLDSSHKWLAENKVPWMALKEDWEDSLRIRASMLTVVGCRDHIIPVLFYVYWLPFCFPAQFLVLVFAQT